MCVVEMVKQEKKLDIKDARQYNLVVELCVQEKIL